MKCPNCQADLVHTHQESEGLQAAEYCRQCGGFWVPAAELHAYEPDVWDNIDTIGLIANEAQSSVTCPQCAARCADVSLDGYPDLQFDRCPSCHGLWLDRGELEALHEIVLTFAEATGSLEHKPQAWSALHWVSYRLGQDFLKRHGGSWSGLD